MVKRTLTEEIIAIVNSVANNNPAPQECVISKIYDNGYVDVRLDIGIIKYIECIGSTSVDSKGIVVYPDGNLNNAKAISITDYYTKAEIEKIVEEIISGQIDLKNYVKKSDVALKFDLETNGYITLGLDIGDGF